VKVNTKTRYGIRTMVEIARHSPEPGIYQKDIALSQKISNKYLDHIMHALKVAGLIRKLGHKGGFVLSRKASEITILDIHNAFEPGICIIDCLDCVVRCPQELECTTKDFWGLLNQTIHNLFISNSLQDLVEQKVKSPGV